MRKQIAILSLMFVAAAAAVGFAVTSRGAGRPHGIDRIAADTQYHASVLPTLKQYCWDCHGDGADKGGVNFDSYTNINTLLADRSMWERVLLNVRSGDMPPKKKKTQPSDSERTNLVAWLDKTLFPVDPKYPDPGRVTLHRLNRVEYNNTVRDLVGVHFEPAADFPQDDVGYGFDNIGDVLSMPPILVEKYLKAAESVMDEAIITGPLPPRPRRFNPGKIKGHVGGSALATLSSNGEMYVDYDAPIGAEYIFKVQAYGDQAGDEKVKIALRADGKDLEQVELRRTKGNSKTVEHRLRLETGRHRLGVAFLNDFYREIEVVKTNANGSKTKEKKIQDRNLQVEGIEVVGPYSDQVPPLTESHRRIFTKQPGPKTTNEVAGEIIRAFAFRAFRRPATDGEVSKLVGLTRQALASGDNFEASIKYALTAVLVSPHFLFRGEIQPDPDNPTSVHKVNEYALASRLSYFLWSSMPDKELFQLAEKGRLRKNLDAQIRRMIADPKSRALVDNFAGQWLQLRTMEIITPDAKLFPGFDDELRDAARHETEKLFEYVLREDRPVTEFLTADYTFVNERLAKHYGIDGVKGADFVKVSLKGTQRGGVLTHASFLALTSNPTRTSPVKRGKWVLENILASPPPPPPPGVPPLDRKELKGTLRQRMDEHRANPVCASCHAKMDPIGFAFEHFDAVGRFRDKDGSEAIDAKGVLTSGESFEGHSQLNAVLAGSKRDDFIRCISEKMLTYALGRGLEYYDRPAVEAIRGRLEKDGLKFSALIRSVVDSVPFQMRRGDGDPLLADAR